ncbi:unnamed protein product [Protopolystoma xenopodis]|uniref:Uncharacterized protein n=1 Tax=Protopolystoma xenopodis TaxID=117903 RepID=A0A3S5B190_9PLAT|nr:unnamed protein product [Protopolystoma xenopodis]
MHFLFASKKLDIPDSGRILEIERLCKLTAKQLEEKFGSCLYVTENDTSSDPNRFLLYEALWTCQNMFTE